MSKSLADLPVRANDPYLAYRAPFPRVDLASPATAILTVDVQYGCLYEAADYYFRRMHEVTIPAIQRLHAAFRKGRRPLFHTHIQSLSPEGTDRSRIHKSLQCHFAPGSREATFIDEVAPSAGEIVFPKTASSVFNSTNIHYVLRNHGVENLVICGVVTTGCVETAVRDAADLGYRVVMPEDACAAIVEDMHWASVRALRDVYAEVCSADDVINRIGRRPDPKDPRQVGPLLRR